LQGWEPAEVTTYEYDDEGLLVRSVTVREIEFTADALAELQAWQVEENEPRGSHGHLLSDAMSRDGDPGNRSRLWDWVVEPSTDFAQRALDKAADAWVKKYPDADANALRWSVKKVFRS